MNTNRIQLLLDENEKLRARLQEAEETLQAIHEGAVDALVVQGPAGDQVFTLSGEEIIYRRLVETMNEAGLTTTPDGTILFCNKRFSQLVRLPMERIVGLRLRRFVTPLSQLCLNQLMTGVQERPVKQRLTLAASDGNSIPVLISANLLHQGDTDYICLVAADMTELDAKNSELKKRADQLSRLVSELTLTEKRERHRLATVLHDHLQQLLVAATFGLAALSRQADAQSREAITEISALIQECVQVSRSLTVELSPTILHESGLKAALKWLARWMHEKHGLQVDLHCPQQVTVEREDIRILLFESVRELLFNVVKHARVEAAKVFVSCPESQIRIVVSDQGAGFDPDSIPGAANRSKGGFGLFSIRERLELIGGTLTMVTAPSQGTAFTLTAPLPAETELPCHVPTEYRAAAPTVAPAAPSSPKMRIMVVDDHAVVRQGLSTLLLCEPMLDLVGHACDGRQAVELARRLRPDVILMDYSMPNLNGPEATQAIRSEMPHVRVIGLSMHDQADHADTMLRAGACAYLSKNGDFRKLMNTICNVHDHPAAPALNG